MAKQIKKVYSENLKHPKWQKKRLEVMSRDNFTCQYRLDKDTTLNVHHKKYTGKPWESANEDLIAVCEHCHAHVLHSEDVSEVKKVYKYKMPWAIAFIINCVDRDILLIVQNDIRISNVIFEKN